MGSGCSSSLCDAPPTCNPLPVARKWQQRRRRHCSRAGSSGRRVLSKKANSGASGATAHLVASSRVPSGMLYANTAARGADEGKYIAGAPAWMASHLLLLYSGVPVGDEEDAETTRGGGRAAASEGIPARGTVENITATEGTGDAVVSMFRGFFGLAERQRRERVSQLTCPF